MKICEIFESIQAEGRYAGVPALFIRLSGCTRDCSFCDSKYHKKGKKYEVDNIVKRIIRSKVDHIIWTGGEPLLQFRDIKKVILKTKVNGKHHHIETNGDLINDDNKTELNQFFYYVCVSPKDLEIAKKIYKKTIFDIKVVTDLKLNKEMIPFATMLMPLTKFNEKKDLEIEKKVWDYCVKYNKRFCLRQHIKIFGYKARGV